MKTTEIITAQFKHINSNFKEYCKRLVNKYKLQKNVFFLGHKDHFKDINKLMALDGGTEATIIDKNTSMKTRNFYIKNL